MPVQLLVRLKRELADPMNIPCYRHALCSCTYKACTMAGTFKRGLADLYIVRCQQACTALTHACSYKAYTIA
eukprot:845987-Pelagomonas_calceolata.AAC.1